MDETGLAGLVAEALASAASVLVLTGAGISAESGIPTYRGPGGLYETDPELTGILTADTLSRDPASIWEHLDAMRRLVAGSTPNAAHEVLSRWEAADRFDRLLVATQNVDGLHQAAGSDRVAELHGSIWEFAAPRTVSRLTDEEFSDDASAFLAGDGREEILRKWSRDNDRDVWVDREIPFSSIPPSAEPDVRPNVLFFDEDYGDRLLWVEHFIRQGLDVVLVVGCSGGVWVLDHLVRLAAKSSPDCRFVNVNPHGDCLSGRGIHLGLTATEALVALDERLPGIP